MGTRALRSISTTLVPMIAVNATKSSPIAAGAQCEPNRCTASGTSAAPMASIAICNASTSAKTCAMMSSRDTRCSSISAVSSYVIVAMPNVTSINMDATTADPASDTATSAMPIANPEIKIHGAIQRRPINMTVSAPAMRQPTPIAVVTKPE
jgi:hypothetical protein